jgi:multidrug efflux pump subunit AcrB/outer membrane protein TolC
VISGQWVISQKRLFAILSLLLVGMGILSLLLAPKSEDPRMPNWFGSITVVLPGAGPQQIDEQISKPLNHRLKEIDELKKIETTTRSEVLIIQLEMLDSIKDTEPVWNKVRTALSEIKADFPAGTLEPKLKTDTNDLETIVFAVHGIEDVLSLKKRARELKDALIVIPGTSRVVLHGDPHEELQVQISDQALKTNALFRARIAQKIAAANTGLPAGAIDLDGRRIQLQANSSLKNAEDLKSISLSQGSGDPIDLRQISQIKLAPREEENFAFWNGKPAIFVGVIAKHPLDIVKYGDRVREEILRYKSLNTGQIKIDEVSFNPDRTQERLADLGLNLILGMLTVGLILWFWMGWRIAAVVSLFVPVISIVGFNFYAIGGGVLHQISLAAFVISLGQFIDNIIVIVESMQSKIEAGLDRKTAAEEVINQFKKPMLFATGTNIAAFLPMLASSGATATFTFAIPVIAIVTLICAWAFGLFVVPMASELILKKQDSGKNLNYTKRLGSQIGQVVSARPGLVVSLSFLILTLSSLGFVFVKKQFFPSADRNQFIVSIELSESNSFSETKQSVAALNEFLNQDENIAAVGSFVGEDVPRFYYNVGLSPWGRHTAKILVITKDRSKNKQTMKSIEDFTAKKLTQAIVLVESLEQGPPILAPIEYRLMSDKEEDLEEASRELNLLLANHRNVKQTKTDLGIGLLEVGVRLDQDLMERFQLSESAMALDLLSQSRGAEVSHLFLDGEKINIKLKDTEKKSIEKIKSSFVLGENFRDLTTNDLALFQTRFNTSAIYRYNGERLNRVLAWPKEGQAANLITGEIGKQIASAEWAKKVKVKEGGEIEGAGEANIAILQTIPLGLFVLVICLMLEFNSIRKVLIILLSLPLVISGVTPGLILGDAAFGFMSLLGVLALVGIVVNNSILLIESIDDEAQTGKTISQAVVAALESRVRPILLTAITTIAGLLPMAFEESTLWPPLAWAMISGLVGSTVITLFFVPAFYVLLFGGGINWPGRNLFLRPSLLIILLSIGLSSTSRAKVYSWDEALLAVENSLEVAIADYQLRGTQELSKAQKAGAFIPKLGLRAEMLQRGRQLTQTNAFGSFNFGKNSQSLAGIELSVPLFDGPKMFGERKSLDYAVKASELSKEWSKSQAQNSLAHFLLQLEMNKKGLESLRRLEKNLKLLDQESERFQKIGLSGKSDRLQIQIELSENLIAQNNSLEQQKTLIALIQTFLPDFEDLDFQIEQVQPAPHQLEKPKFAEKARADLQALQMATLAQAENLNSIRQGHLPSLELNGRWIYADQGQLDQTNWTEASIVLKWALFEGGARSSQISQAAASLSQKKAEESLAQRKVAAQQLEKRQNFLKVSEQLGQSLQNIERAQQALSEDKANAKKGKILIRHWLESEIRLEQKRLDYELFRIQKLASWIELRTVHGEGFFDGRKK